jgi:hypothetical protein
MASLVEDFLHPNFFAEVPFADEHDLQAVLGGQSFVILSQGVAQGLSKPGIIKNQDLPSLQVRRHALGVTEARQRSWDQDAVVARKHARDFIGMTLGQQFHGPSSPSWKEDIIDNRPSQGNDSTCLVPAMPG